MEGFSDGVFGIAATLLVLEITLHPPGSALEQLLHAWPSYLGYVVSFLTIGAAWLGHSVLTARLSGADSLLLRINLILLLVIGFLPFPTRLVSEALHDVEGERVFITLYGLTLLTIRLLQLALNAYARRAGLYVRTGETEEDKIEHREVLPVIVAYVAAILVGLALPRVAVVLYFGIAVYLVLPIREVGRAVFRR
jgi:uncharacterized membrane protein